MDDQNATFKEEGGELLDKLMAFKKRYLVPMNCYNIRPDANTPFVNFERELRMMLFVARTAEENREQKKKDNLI